ncbi:hypothetical protein [Thermoanaerobacterium thermosulfurigenes]|uniref:hypothetical protein n=1 Tax=Thermoanaerobacterium thermosulfurigenes TaxID=33950 RepID=UPI003EF27F88
MILDIDTKLLKKNAYRVTKQRGITALRIRVPGGDLNIKYLDIIKEIAEKYGNGIVNITTRQGFEIPGIPMEKINEINELISPIIRDEGVQIEDEEGGYPAAGTRNVSSCIGNRVCPFANYDTTALALKIEKLIYPNDYLVKTQSLVAPMIA